MANIIQLKRSAIAASVPTTANLAVAEMAFNTADDALFISNGTTVVRINESTSILDTALKRFVSDAQIASWDAKQGAIGFTPANVAGDTFTGPVILSGDPTLALEASTKQYVDAGLAGKQATIGFTPLNVAGDTMTGALVLNADPAVALGAATKQYVDTGLAGKQATIGFTPLNVAGDTMSGVLNLGTNVITNVGSPVSASDAVNKSYVDSALAGLDFQPDAINIQLDATLNPGLTPVLGDRYIITDVAALNTNFGTITAVGNGDIVEYNGTVFAVSYDVSVLGSGAMVWNTTVGVFYYYDGTAWSEFGGLAGVTAGTGLVKAGNTLDINMGAGIIALPTDEVGIDLWASSGLQLTDNGVADSVLAGAKLAVKLDGTSLSRAANGLSIAAAGVTSAHLSTGVAGTGLTGGAGTALAVGAGTGITVQADAVSLDVTYTDGRYINNTGDTLTGFLVTHADPTLALHVANKQYVDAAVAVIDGGTY